MIEEWTQIQREDFEPIREGQAGYLVSVTSVNDVGMESERVWRLSLDKPTGLDGRRRESGDLGTELSIRRRAHGLYMVDKVRRVRVRTFEDYDENLHDGNSRIVEQAVLRPLGEDEREGLLRADGDVIDRSEA